MYVFTGHGVFVFSSPAGTHALHIFQITSAVSVIKFVNEVFLNLDEGIQSEICSTKSCLEFI